MGIGNFLEMLQVDFLQNFFFVLKGNVLMEAMKVQEFAVNEKIF